VETATKEAYDALSKRKFLVEHKQMYLYE